MGLLSIHACTACDADVAMFRTNRVIPALVVQFAIRAVVAHVYRGRHLPGLVHRVRQRRVRCRARSPPDCYAWIGLRSQLEVYAQTWSRLLAHESDTGLAPRSCVLPVRSHK